MNANSIVGWAWYIIGVVSFVYWWTKDSDLKVGDTVLMAMCGVLGPIAFIIGFIIHSSVNSILIKKRPSK